MSIIETKRRQQLCSCLPDDFSKTMLDGALRVAGDKDNPMRIHQFAASMRELFAYILQSAAPDDEVRACVWFEQATDTSRVTRRQRAVYATQGGLTDAYVEELGVDVAELHSDAIRVIEVLNKATHVRPDRVISDDAEAYQFVETAVASLEGLLDSFRLCREMITRRLEDGVYERIMQEFVQRTFLELDLLSSHGCDVGPFIDVESIEVVNLNSKEINVCVSGVAPVTLYYGRGDDMAEIGHDFPFKMLFSAPVGSPLLVSYVDCHIDDSGWYGDGKEFDEGEQMEIDMKENNI